MNSIAVIIPTHNRPELLLQAIDSVKKQTRSANEIIVVDDGSQVPVSEDQLQRKFGSNIKVLRNNSSRGLASARNQGVEYSSSDLITHLDDDDLLAPEALADAADILENEEAVEIVFIGAKGFGERGGFFDYAQNNAVSNVIDYAHGEKRAEGVILFDDHLIHALLKTVPIAFQRVLVSKPTWRKISDLRINAYMHILGVTDEKEAMSSIVGTLRDSEWALYAALTCRKTALLQSPRYLQRCEGQGYSSKPEKKYQHIFQHLSIMRNLYRASLVLEKLGSRRILLKRSLADLYFNYSYQFLHEHQRLKSWRLLLSSFLLVPSLRKARFAALSLLPLKPVEYLRKLTNNRNSS